MPIRLRLALAFAAATAIAFALGSWLFISALSAAQLGTIDSQLAVQLTQAAGYLPAGHPGTSPAAVSPAPGEYVVQVVDAANQVRGASRDAGATSLLTAAELSQARHGRITVTRLLDEENERITAAPLAGHPGWAAVAGVSLETFEATQGQAARELVIGGAVAVAVAGLGAYWLARSALSPVERLRRQVAALSERDDEGAGVEIPRTGDEIAALAGTMNDLLGRLQRALARQRGFVADASHELRTPFAVLRGELELAGRPGRTREELAAAVQSAAEEAARLARITDDLLLLARSDEDRLTVRLEPSDIGSLLTRSAERAGSRFTAAGLSYRIDVPAGLRAEVDPDRIRQAIDNLLGNAARFAPAGSAVVVTARAAGSALEIEVADAGPGFPADFLPHAFERFRRPDGGRARSDGGAGLGLAIVQAIAAAHGGSATAANGPSGGAAVRLCLPHALAPLSPAATPPAPRPP